jgi:hypothetical protein
MISDEELDKGMKTLNMIWFVMLGSLGVYVIVGLHAGPNMKITMSEDLFSVMRMALYVLAIITLISTRYIRKNMLSSKAQNKQQVESGQNPVLQKYTSAMVVAWTLSESGAIFGLVIFFFGKNTMDLYVFTLISAVAMIINRPSRDEIISLSRGQREPY